MLLAHGVVWADAVAGCGVNVSNSEPTDCINDVIARHNTQHGTALPLLRKEVVAPPLQEGVTAGNDT